MMSRASQILVKYLPEGSVDEALKLLQSEPIDFKISKPRKTKLGDYRFPRKGSSHHRISVNADLNPYAFLITLVHEVAHLKAFKLYGRGIKPHGSEWQQVFRELCDPFFALKVFPDDVEQALRKSLQKGHASSCTDLDLHRSLQQFKQQDSELVTVESLAANSYFSLGRDKLFKKGPRLRKRYRCLNMKNGREYMVHPLAEVLPLNPEKISESV